MKSKSKLEAEVFEAWKTLYASDAFTGGLKEYAGRVFIPTPKNVRNILQRIARLEARSKHPSEKGLLASISRLIAIGEPGYFPGDILGAFFTHLIKEGINKPHLLRLSDESIKALKAALEYTDKKWAPGIKVLALIRCYGLLEILKTVESEAKDPAIAEKIGALRKLTIEYAKHFNVPGFNYNATFDQTYALLKKQGCDLGREKIYAQALRDLYDYEETPSQVEAAGLKMLESEFPAFQSIVKLLAKEFNSQANAEMLAKAIHKRRGLKQKQIIPFLMEIRKSAQALCNKHIVRINTQYKTQVIETPPYLTGIFPSGGAFFFDFLTAKPFQVFVATTDPHRSPSTVPAELLNLLVHEEYGHCVHGSNSVHAYAAKPTLAESLTSIMGGAISEGISFQREKEFMDLLDEIAKMKRPGREEKTFIDLCKKYGGFEAIRREYEFYTRMWRIVRFLRVIGDARINSGKQNIVEFVEWAHKKTGLSKSLVYFQVFPAHQGSGPGYASTYAIIGERIRSIQEEAKINGVSLRDLNTYACSMGFPPKRVFERRLLEYARAK